MSRLGKKPILIPKDVEIKIEGSRVYIKGPLGELERRFSDLIKIEKKDDFIKLIPQKKTKHTSALWGTTASHLRNMIEGTMKGFSKNLILEGIGYKAQIVDGELVLTLGFSHPVKLSIPKGIEIKVEKNKIQVSGINKELVGEIAAKIRAFKKPEPYKGKGIRYEGEVIRRKAGKKAVGVT